MEALVSDLLGSLLTTIPYDIYSGGSLRGRPLKEDNLPLFSFTFTMPVY